MHRLYMYILLFVSVMGFCQNGAYKSAADELLSQIDQIEKGHGYPLQWPKSIACLTGIYPKKIDGTYVGIVYYPTLDELHIWRNWIKENQLEIKYKNQPASKSDSDIWDFSEIVYEYEPGKYRSNNCK